MKKITITIRDIKEIKKSMDEVDRMKDRYAISNDDGTQDYGDKQKIIDYHEKSVKNNVSIAAKLLGIDYDTVIDMCYDFDFAKYVLADIKEKKQW